VNTTERSILELQLAAGLFDSEEDPKFAGIAKSAVERGYSSLSDLQKQALAPFLTQDCPGYVDLTDDQIPCGQELEGQQLLKAYQRLDPLTETVRCSACSADADRVAHDRAKR